MRQYTLLTIGLFLMFNTLSALGGQRDVEISVGPASREPDRDKPRGEPGNRGGRNRGNVRDSSRGGREAPGATVPVNINGQTFKVTPKVKSEYDNFKSKANNPAVNVAGDIVPVLNDAQAAELSAEVVQQKFDAVRRNDRGAERLWNYVGEQIRNRSLPFKNLFDTKDVTLPPLPGETYRSQKGFEYSLKPNDLRKLRQLRNMIFERPDSASAYYLMLSDFVFDLRSGTFTGRMNGRDRLLLNKALLCLPESEEKQGMESQWRRMSGPTARRFTAPFWAEMLSSLRSLHLPFQETSDDLVLFDKAEPSGCEPVSPLP